MKTLKIVNNDLVFNKNGELEMVEGREEEAQSIERIFSTNIKEFFLDPEHGFDYGVLKVKKPDQNTLRLALINAATQDQRVKTANLLVFKLGQEKRKAVIEFKLKMKNGSTIESEVSL